MRLAYLIFVVFLFSCSQQNQHSPLSITENKTNSVAESTEEMKSVYNDLETVSAAYISFLDGWKRKYSTLESVQEKNELLFHAVKDSLPYFWTGTEWDFNGMSREPQHGQVACGYFVTNTLTDLGYRIRRIYLAQQAASVMIEKLSHNKVKRFVGEDLLFQHLSDLKEEHVVFLIGLDYHVGYLIKDGSKVYFLHSDYINRSGVKLELAAESQAFLASEKYVLGRLVLP